MTILPTSQTIESCVHLKTPMQPEIRIYELNTHSVLSKLNNSSRVELYSKVDVEKLRTIICRGRHKQARDGTYSLKTNTRTSSNRTLTTLTSALRAFNFVTRESFATQYQPNRRKGC